MKNLLFMKNDRKQKVITLFLVVLSVGLSVDTHAQRIIYDCLLG
jgi:hypothetical protein